MKIVIRDESILTANYHNKNNRTKISRHCTAPYHHFFDVMTPGGVHNRSGHNTKPPHGVDTPPPHYHLLMLPTDVFITNYSPILPWQRLAAALLLDSPVK